jgi:hypothetical protein
MGRWLAWSRAMQRSAMSRNTGAATSAPDQPPLLGESITTMQLYLGLSAGKNPQKLVEYVLV